MFNPSNLYDQVRHFYNVVKEFKESDDYVESYLIHVPGSKFIDINGLKEYLGRTTIVNPLEFQKIGEKCRGIINIWNLIKEKPIRSWDNKLLYSQDSSSTFFSNCYVMAISIMNGKIVYANYIDKFISSQSYESLTFSEIAHKCKAVISIIDSYGIPTSLKDQNDLSQVIKSIPKRVIIGSLFLSGEADKKYSELKSWRKVAEHFDLVSFHGQFSATSKKASYNENNVFDTHKDKILKFCKSNNIKLLRKDYL